MLGREWRILDSGGRETQVQGEGIVGQQPIIAPGGVYVYDSFVTLEDVPGRMYGHYEVRDAWGQMGRVQIPAFMLAYPLTRQVN